jgi:hypothetical protein
MNTIQKIMTDLFKDYLIIKSTCDVNLLSNKFHEIFSAKILYALSTNCNRLVEETFPAPKSQKNK